MKRFTDEEFLAAIAPPSTCHKDARRKLGYSVKKGSGGSNHQDRYWQTFVRLNPDISHFSVKSKSSSFGTSLETKLMTMYQQYRKDAEKRGHEFDISFEEFVLKTNSFCYFCGTMDINDDQGFVYELNGIDRLDNEIGYKSHNAVPACTDCNLSKHTRKEGDFISHAHRVSYHQGRITTLSYPSDGQTEPFKFILSY